MRREFWLMGLLAALVLTACAHGGNQQGTVTPEQPPEPQKPPVEDVAPEPPADGEEPLLLEELAVELVVDWQDSDRLLSRLEDMVQLLQAGLARQGVDAERVTVTISTAGGVTADALKQGGVDMACLPAEDYLTCEAAAAAVLTSDETPCRTVVAASVELEPPVREALGRALLETKEGMAFLETCATGRNMIPAEEKSMQALRDWVAAEEESHGA